MTRGGTMAGGHLGLVTTALLHAPAICVRPAKAITMIPSFGVVAQ